MSQTAKLFVNGRSQAVRLPAAFRFDGQEVFIRKDELTGDVILSRRPDDWSSFLTALQNIPLPDDFLSPQERQTQVHALPDDRDPFEGLS